MQINQFIYEFKLQWRSFQKQNCHSIQNNLLKTLILNWAHFRPFAVVLNWAHFKPFAAVYNWPSSSKSITLQLLCFVHYVNTVKETPYKISWGISRFEHKVRKSLNGGYLTLRWLIWDHWIWKFNVGKPYIEEH
jgi:hypothetical protein